MYSEPESAYSDADLRILGSALHILHGPRPSTHVLTLLTQFEH